MADTLVIITLAMAIAAMIALFLAARSRRNRRDR